MTITNIPLSDLKPNTRNVRIHSAKQTEEYKRSLQKYGQIKPIICDEDGVIWIGNGLYEAMKSLGMKEAACYVKTGMTEHEKLKMMMADNKVYELGLTDLESIDEILKDLNGDFDIPGYDDHLLETITMSFQETDDFISSYGSFSEEDVANVRKNEEKVGNTAGSPDGTVPGSDMVTPIPDAGTPGTAIEAGETGQEAGRYIICPHCGERICL